MKTIIIAAPHSGSGKTTITLGIMECLKRRGLVVAPFKVGPDFIDPGYHRLVCGWPSTNLDGWMCSEEFVCETFARNCAGADIAVIEGVMGLFDGIGGSADEGSTAQIARVLGVPVVLVVDAKSQARSAAALVKGFVEFDPAVRIAGVIFNNVGSANHAAILREAMVAALPNVPVLGCIPRDEALHIPSRHLGLVTSDENPLPADFLDHLVTVIEQHVDVGGQVYKFQSDGVKFVDLTPVKTVKMAVARDAAFCFVYEDSLRLLQEAGAELVEFSPLADSALPNGVCGLYLPGGYPELFAETLAANGTMKQSIRDAIGSGMPVYAECGGFIYLTRGVDDHDFVGIFPTTTRMLPKRKVLGYREIELMTDTIIGPAGTVARGHEFHYSEMEPMPVEVERVYRVRRQGVDLGMEGYRYRNCLASYVHLHFGSCTVLAAAFVKSCREFKDS
jgi:cobyrinic acid a,c-diamide synthase